MTVRFISFVWMVCIINGLLLYAQDDYSVIRREIRGMERAIYLYPAKSYKRLQEIEKLVDPDAENFWVDFYLRKAQAQEVLFINDQFLATVEKGLTYITTSTPTVTRILYSLNKGVAEQRQGKYDVAIRTLDIAVKQAQDHKLWKIYTTCLIELGYVKSVNQYFDFALIDMQTAKTMAMKLEDPFLMAQVEETYGAIYSYLDEYEKSLEYYENALKKYKKLKFTRHFTETLYGMAITYRYQKNWNKAINSFQEYLVFTKDIKIENGSLYNFYGLYGLGMTYGEKGEYGKALQIIKKALNLYGPKDYMAELYKVQAVCFAKIGQIKEAYKAVEQAKLLFAQMPELKNTTWSIDVLKSEATVLFCDGKFKQSYDLLSIFHEKYLMKYQKNSSEQIQKLRQKMVNENNDLENELAIIQRQFNEIELENQTWKNEKKQWLIAFVVIVGGMILFAIVWQSNFKKKMKDVSMLDGLTDAFNHQYTFEKGRKMIQNLDFERGQLSIMVLEVDKLEHINYKYGHVVGDEILKKVVDIGNEIIRFGDLIGRVEGKYFLIILPRIPVGQAMSVAKRYNQIVKEHSFDFFQGEPIQYYYKYRVG